MIELVKKYDRSIVLILTAITFLFGYYYTVKATVKDVSELKPKVESLQITSIRHDELIKTMIDSQKEIRQDIKSILRSVK